MANAPFFGLRDKPGTTPGFLVFMLVVPAFFLILLILLGGMQYKQMKSFLSEHPSEFAALSDTSGADAPARIRAFFGDTAADTLALSGPDLDYLVRTNPSLKQAGWNYRIGLEDTAFWAASSLPVRQMHGPASIVPKLLRMRGYLNSVIKARPELEAGKITLVPVAATMNGIKAPLTALTRNGNVNVRDWVGDKDFYDKAIAQLAEAKIAGGRLLLIKRK